MNTVYRAAQPKNSMDINRQIYEKGARIEQEFAEFFTGENLNTTALAFVTIDKCNAKYLVHTNIITDLCSCCWGWLGRRYLQQGEEYYPWAVGQLHLGTFFWEHLTL